VDWLAAWDDPDREHGMIRVHLALHNAMGVSEEDISEQAMAFGDDIVFCVVESGMSPLSAPTFDIEPRGDALVVTVELDVTKPDGWTDADQAMLTTHLRGLVG
jgi:hypothetical protein